MGWGLQRQTGRTESFRLGSSHQPHLGMAHLFGDRMGRQAMGRAGSMGPISVQDKNISDSGPGHCHCLRRRVAAKHKPAFVLQKITGVAV